MRAADRKTNTAWAAWVAAVIATLTPQLLGGATPATRACALVLAVTLGLAATFACSGSDRSIGTTPLAVWGAAGAAVWTFLQAIPLPCSVVDAAWPGRAALSEQLAALGITGTPQCTISRAPGASWSAFALALCLCSVLASSAALSRLGHRRLLAKSVLWSSLIMAAVALGHTVADAHTVFGIYAPQHARPGLLLAPLLNGNHLAALLTLGLPMTVWQLQTSERAEQRILWAGACLGLSACIVLTLSRSGMLASAAATGLYLTAPASASSARATPEKNLKKRRIVLSLCAVALCLIAAYGADLIAREFGDTNSIRAKIELARKSFAVALEHPWLGVGRGAFGDVSAPLAAATSHAAFAENLLAHWFVEWGIPVSLFVLASILATESGIRRQRGLTYAVACGLFGLLLHDAADFSLELPGVAIPAAIALGTLLYSRTTGESGPRPAFRLKATLVPIALAAAASLALTWNLQTANSRAASRERLEVLLAKKSDTFVTVLAESLHRYPLDPSLYVLGAAHAVRAQSRFAAHWLNLAMTHAPGWANPHLQASYWLERQGRIEQAAIEMGIAIEKDMEGTIPSACELLVRHFSAQIVWLMTPPGRLGQTVVEQLAHCIRLTNRLEPLSDLLGQILQRYPASLGARAQQVQVLGRQGRALEAIESARTLARLAPDYAPGVAVLIRALSENGDPQAAWRVYQAAPASVRRERSALMVVVDPLVKLHNLADLREVLDTLQAQSRSSEDDLNLAVIAGEAYARTGEEGRALAVLQGAYRRHRDPALLERIHGLASSAGLGDVALRAALELCHLRHREGAFCEDVKQ